MLVNYCTFYNNIVSSDKCILLSNTSCTISKCNIILNNCPNNNSGVIFVKTGNFNLLECIFHNNENILLYVNTGTLQLINCYYLTGSSSSYGSITNSLINTISNIFQHSIYFTYYCSYIFIGNSSVSTKNIFKFLNYIYLFEFLIL